MGNKEARGEIAAAKALAPSAVLAVLDRAIQVSHAVFVSSARLKLLSVSMGADGGGGGLRCWQHRTAPSRRLASLAQSQSCSPTAASFSPCLPPSILQTHGGAGVSDVTPLAHMWAGARTLRLADVRRLGGGVRPSWGHPRYNCTYHPLARLLRALTLPRGTTPSCLPARLDLT